jgi:hypothetical protein
MFRPLFIVDIQAATLHQEFILCNMFMPLTSAGAAIVSRGLREPL